MKCFILSTLLLMQAMVRLSTLPHQIVLHSLSRTDRRSNGFGHVLGRNGNRYTITESENAHGIASNPVSKR